DEPGGEAKLRLRASFLILNSVIHIQSCRGKVGRPAFGLSTFPWLFSSRRWECGNRASDFQGLWATEENLLSVFLGVHSPSFPPPSFTPSSSVRWRRTASASLLACARPLPCRFPPPPVSPGRPASRQVRQLPQNLPRRGIPSVHPPLFALRVGDHLGHAARPVIVQIRIHVLFEELLNRFRMPRLDVPVAHMFSNDRSVLGFHQPVVIGVPRPRFGLLHQ